MSPPETNAISFLSGESAGSVKYGCGVTLEVTSSARTEVKFTAAKLSVKLMQTTLTAVHFQRSGISDLRNQNVIEYFRAVEEQSLGNYDLQHSLRISKLVLGPQASSPANDDLLILVATGQARTPCGPSTSRTIAQFFGTSANARTGNVPKLRTFTGTAKNLKPWLGRSRSPQRCSTIGMFCRRRML